MANIISAAEALELVKKAWEDDIQYVDKRIRSEAEKGKRMTCASVEYDALEFVSTLLTDVGYVVEKDGYSSVLTIRW